MDKSAKFRGLFICMLFLGSLFVPLKASAAPTAPSHLVASAADATSIALAWHDNSDNETAFAIYRLKEGADSYALIGEVEANHVIYGDSGLQPGTKYYYRIKAYGPGGNSESNIASATTPEAAVSVTSPDGGETWNYGESHNITWTSNGEGFQAQLRYRFDDSAWIDIATVPNTNSYSWTIPNINSSHVRVAVRLLYHGHLLCVDQSHADFTIEGMTIVFPGPFLSLPAAPSVLTCTAHPENVSLEWADNSTNETGFRIERKTGSGPFTEIGTAGADATTYNDTTISHGNIYTYRVCAYNDAGNSSYSNERVVDLTAEMLVEPLAPTTLAATAVSTGSINLSWVNPGVNSGTEVERLNSSSTFVTIAELASGAATFTDTGLSAGTAYTYRVRAFNQSSSGVRSYSGYSNPASAATLEESTPPTTSSGQTILRFYIDSTEYYVQGPSDSGSRLQTMDTAPIISGGRTLLPISYVSVPLGATVNWDAALDQVTVHLGSQTVVLWINNNTARINDVETAIDPANPAVTPIIVPPGRTMMPLSFIALNLGCQVDWNPELREVTVSYPKS